jgi:hypothetical protein
MVTTLRIGFAAFSVTVALSWLEAEAKPSKARIMEGMRAAIAAS